MTLRAAHKFVQNLVCNLSDKCLNTQRKCKQRDLKQFVSVSLTTIRLVVT